MIAQIMQEYSNDKLGQAKQAGYDIKIGQSVNSIEFSVQGYREKLGQVISTPFKVFEDLEFADKNFDILKSRIV